MRMALYALLFATVTATVIVNARIMTISGSSNGYCSRSYVNGRWITLGKCELQSGRSLESVVTSLQKLVERESGEATISDLSTESYSDSTTIDSIDVTTSTSAGEPDAGISTVTPSDSTSSDSIEATTFTTAGSSTVFHGDTLSTDSVQVTTLTATAEPDIAPSKGIDSDASTIDSVQVMTLTNAAKSYTGPLTLSYTESSTAELMNVTSSVTAAQHIIDSTMKTFSTVSHSPRNQSSIEQGCGVDSDAKPAASILHVNIGGTATYDSSKSQCGNQGKRLCSAIEVCNLGTPVYGVLEGDHWIAIQDQNNEWIQIGNASGKTCIVYGPKYGLPCWGERSDGSVKSWLGHVYCCSVTEQ